MQFFNSTLLSIALLLSVHLSTVALAEGTLAANQEFRFPASYFCLKHSSDLQATDPSNGLCFTEYFDGRVFRHRHKNSLSCINLGSYQQSSDFFTIQGKESYLFAFFFQTYIRKPPTTPTKDILDRLNLCDSENSQSSSQKGADLSEYFKNLHTTERTLTVAYPAFNFLVVFDANHGGMPLDTFGDYTSIPNIPTGFILYKNFCSWASAIETTDRSSYCGVLAKILKRL